MSTGILYIASGRPYVEEAAVSAERVKDVMPWLSITIVADRPPEADVFDEYIKLEEPRFEWQDKVENLHRTPYERTVYFDSDIYVRKEFSELFDIISLFDLAMVPDPNQHPVLHSECNWQTAELYSGGDEALTEFNAGVIAYRMSDSFEDFLEAWRAIYDPDEHWSDQPSLRIALSKSDIRFYPLRPQYNYMPALTNLLNGEVKIAHNRLIESPGLEFRDKDVPPAELPAVVTKVNKNAHTPRVTYPAFGNAAVESSQEIVVRPPASLVERIYYSFRGRGIVGTARAAIRKLRWKIRH